MLVSVVEPGGEDGVIVVWANALVRATDGNFIVLYHLKGYTDSDWTLVTQKLAAADGADDYDVPRIAPEATVTWMYEVANTGEVAFPRADVLVTDSQAGVTPVLDVASDDGDLILSPDETWIYTASAPALDLVLPSAGVTIVPGCNDGRNTYENIGRVDVAGTMVFDEDISHYCNTGDIEADGVTDSADNCMLKANGPLIPDVGGNSQLDTDEDGYGNICDPDFDGNLIVNAADLAYMKTNFFTAGAVMLQ